MTNQERDRLVISDYRMPKITGIEVYDDQRNESSS